MKLARKKHKTPFVPLASMSDIVFLMIIFFVLTSDFKKDLLKAEPPTDELIEEQPKSRVSVTLDEEGDIYLQGDPANIASLESQVKQELERCNETLVMVTIDATMPEKKFRPVLMALSRAGAKIALVAKKGK